MRYFFFIESSIPMCFFLNFHQKFFKSIEILQKCFCILFKKSSKTSSEYPFLFLLTLFILFKNHYRDSTINCLSERFSQKLLWKIFFIGQIFYEVFSSSFSKIQKNYKNSLLIFKLCRYGFPEQLRQERDVIWIVEIHAYLSYANVCIIIDTNNCRSSERNELQD